MRGLRFAVLLALICAASAAAAQTSPPEPPSLRLAGAAGALPPLAERLPETPRRDLPARDGWREGAYGGTLRTLARGGRDPRDLVLLGYARPVVWNEDFELVPDILQSVTVEEERIFTLKLRAGHRWSDGAPFTSEDFRFWWEDVANNPQLSPSGPPQAMLVGGQRPAFELLDETTVRFAWDTPNPEFLPALAAASPMFIYRPAHYLKDYHAKYGDRQRLTARARDFGLEDWRALYHRQDRMFTFDNPALPTLQPWKNTTAPPAERFVATRNPYFHRVDSAGRQLPYIDRIEVIRADARLIPTKAAAGESDLQARGLSFADFTVLKEAADNVPISVRLWPVGRGAQLALYPNLNAVAPVWRALLRDVRFRRALSLAIDRAEIVRAIYQGFAIRGGNSVLPESSLYRPALRSVWTRFDLQQAKALLDAIGLTRDSGGLRRLPDGRPLQVVVETAEVDPVETDVLQLIAETWREAGIDLVVHATGRQAGTQRVQSGVATMTLFYGLANGLATPQMSPAELAPTGDKQRQWPLWGLHFQSGGERGEAPELPAAQELLELYKGWRRAGSDAVRREIWDKMLAVYADQVFSIGIVGQVRQPVVARKDLRNLPESAPYLYEPGAYFGIYRPDTFWIEQRNQ